MNLQQKKIFIVDDDKLASELYKWNLNQKGYNNTSVFNDGITALKYLVEDPAIVFLDYQMDTLNGFELLTKIKRFNPNILVVMISGQDDMKVAINSLKYGAFDYIIKDENELSKIDEVMDRINFYFTEIENDKPSLVKKVISFFSTK